MGGTDVLVEEVAVDGPVERVLERPAVEQAHPFLLRRPPRQVPCRRRHRPRRRRSAPFLLSPLAAVVGLGDWGSDSDGVTASQVCMGCLDWIGHCSDIGLQAHLGPFCCPCLFFLVHSKNLHTFLSSLCALCSVHTSFLDYFNVLLKIFLFISM